MEYFSCREMIEGLLGLRQQVLKVEMGEDKRLEMNVKVFLWRKNIVIGKLDDAFKILTAAFGIELDFMRLHKMSLVFMFMGKAMRTRFCSIDETSRQMMLFGAVVEFDIPTHRNEKHHEGHQKGTDLPQSFFHGAKVWKKV